MNIKLFFRITGEFFDLMYSGGSDCYYDENDDVNGEKKDIENAIDSHEELCYCEGCSISRQIMSFIDNKFYGIVNNNKIN